jgi:hypothetical protein
MLAELDSFFLGDLEVTVSVAVELLDERVFFFFVFFLGPFLLKVLPLVGGKEYPSPLGLIILLREVGILNW